MIEKKEKTQLLELYENEKKVKMQFAVLYEKEKEKREAEEKQMKEFLIKQIEKTILRKLTPYLPRKNWNSYAIYEVFKCPKNYFDGLVENLPMALMPSEGKQTGVSFHKVYFVDEQKFTEMFHKGREDFKRKAKGGDTVFLEFPFVLMFREGTETMYMGLKKAPYDKNGDQTNLVRCEKVGK